MFSIFIIRALKGLEEESRDERLLKEIRTENFPNLAKYKSIVKKT